MLTGMTGFGQGVFEDSKCKISIQIQSVNRKFCEIVINLPRELASLENRINREISKRVQRGYITVSVTVESYETPAPQIFFNRPLIRKYIEGLRLLGREFKVDPSIDLNQILKLPDAVLIRAHSRALPPNRVWPPMRRALDAALKDFNVMRTHEGEQIFKELSQRLGKIDRMVDEARAQVSQTVRHYRNLLHENLAGLSLKGEGKGVDAAMEKEISSFSEKIDTAEELKRLEIHMTHFLQVMKNSRSAAGRKLDFITQEMNREINTLSAKSNDARISKMAVDVKSELDKIREQLQNVE